MILYFLLPLIFIAVAGLRVLQQYQRGLVFRLGRYSDTREPGLTWIIPGIDRMQTVDMRVVTQDIEPQETMTNDNVPVKVRAVVWYKVVNPQRAIIEVVRFEDAVRQTALTSLRSVMGQHSLDELLKEQEKLSAMLGEIMDKVTEPWGVEVDRVQIKDVEIPQSMQRAMAQEAEAHREKRARIIKAEAEHEAALKLTEAATLMAKTPMAIELRRMQMLTEVGAEQNTMTIVMMPSEFVTAASAYARMVDKADVDTTPR
ncbi:slipin family protein [Pseudolysobacter antarcticus]|uniref:Slipin family protein n=1 Tax=Pseudolysobacter antarcticus TaxID=2511995 RepID=A0A411HJZ3_9GAMM|nr:slipin family protein [Pseudolysobacter antarcticus]QBB70852.1 slipin family protein [Pseudolysobacter antarcticus]